ncbi:MAG: hypothetical protein ABI847_19500, partial [Anaerolineales bacterium]
ASTLAILTIIWFLAFPQPQRLADALFSLLAVLAVLAFAVSLGLWSQQATTVSFYNNTLQETAWEMAQIVLLIGGGILLAVRRRPEWRLGLAIVVLLLAGHAIHYSAVVAQSSIPGIERLFEILAVPLLAAAIYRRAHAELPALPASADKLPAELPISEPEPPAVEPPAPSGFDPRAASAFAELGAATSLTELQNLATTAVAHALAAPLVLLLLPDPGDPASFTAASAYDLGQLQHIGRPFALRLPPGLITGLGQGGSVAWLSGDDEPELHALIVVAELPSPSPIVLTAIQASSGALLALLATLPPAAVAEWAMERRTWLASLAETIRRAWETLGTRSQPAASAEPADDSQREAALAEAARLQRAVQLQAEQLQRFERAEAARADELAELESLRASLHALQPEIEASRQRQQQLEAELAELSAAQAAAAKAAAETTPVVAVEVAPAAAVDVALGTAVEAAPETAAATAADAAQAVAEAAEADQLRSTLAMLQPELDYYRQQEQVLNTELERLRGQLVEQAALLAAAPVAEAEALRASLKSLAIEVETVRAEHAQHAAEAARLGDELAASQAEQA